MSRNKFPPKPKYDPDTGPVYLYGLHTVRAALDNPRLVLFVLACVFAVSAGGLVTAWLVLRRLPESERFMIGYGTGQRNMGLLVAALGAGVSPTTFLFFALAQFPIYLLPWLLGGIAGRIRRREAADGR